MPLNDIGLLCHSVSQKLLVIKVTNIHKLPNLEFFRSVKQKHKYFMLSSEH